LRQAGPTAAPERRILALLVIPWNKTMQYIQHLGPVAALIAGVLILIMPRLLNYIIALYLIVTGLVGLFGK
jgi:hypothetical protein